MGLNAWTHDEDMRLCDFMAEDKHMLWQIAIHIGKTPSSVKQRWRRICAMYGETPDSTISGVGRVRDQK